MQKTVTYFEKPGPDNTAHCLEIVVDHINTFKYRHVVVATTRVSTGVLFAEGLKKLPAFEMLLPHIFFLQILSKRFIPAVTRATKERRIWVLISAGS